jgi:hypothetical protein
MMPPELASTTAICWIARMPKYEARTASGIPNIRNGNVSDVALRLKRHETWVDEAFFTGDRTRLFTPNGVRERAWCAKKSRQVIAPGLKCWRSPQ